MKFIYPQNFNYKTKLFGIFDMQTLIFLLIFGTFIFIILKIFGLPIMPSLSIFIILNTPIWIFAYIFSDQENIVYILTYLLAFLFSQKIFLFFKD